MFIIYLFIYFDDWFYFSEASFLSFIANEEKYIID